MKIAIWNNPVTYPVLEGFKTAFGEGVYPMARTEILKELRDGIADVALIPSDLALAHPEDFDILPAVAVSTWNNPYAILTVSQTLGSKTLGIIHGNEGSLSALVAAVVLKEHYGTVVALNERDDLPAELSPHALISVPLEGDASASDADPITIDLAQEWYELTSYPFVWAVFATRKGAAGPDVIRAVRDAMIAIDDNRVAFSKKWNDNPEMESFFLNDLRMRLDDLAVASLTEMCDHLYFYGLTEEINPVMFASLPPDEDEDAQA